ncbi:hypothetical protein MMMDOFMJ_2683 [Methylobacterium gnaphalii]|nr:hypothetical protein MMMDOFMJ_2683 [Methylobacterium gnaphalii]
MAGRYRVQLGIVPETVVAITLDHAVLHTARKRLHVLRHLGRLAEGVGGFVIGDLLALDRLTVDVEHARDHLDLVAGQADDALDVVGGVVLRQLEDGDVAALRLGAPDAGMVLAGQVLGERQRVFRVAVGVFRYEQIVADQQCRHQRARGDVERLEQQGAHDEGNEQSLNADLQRFADARPGSGFGFGHPRLLLRVVIHARLFHVVGSEAPGRSPQRPRLRPALWRRCAAV